ncbi:septum formation protein Maf [Hyphobacterium sp. CCMP332]|nr:septum formation protein Maf [Hyphobacterium sp. CCMP332]
MYKNLSKYTILLGSKSPRRAALLKQSNLLFRKVFIDIEESFPKQLQPSFAAMYIAERKSMHFREFIEDEEILLTSDTVVVIKNKILAKPKDKQEAKSMLKLLSGDTHEVITAVCMRNENKKKVFYDSSKVYFENLDDEAIDYYIENFKPFDKAGAYGIQEWIGLTHIKRIEGSYFNIVGLPCHLIVEAIKNW